MRPLQPADLAEARLQHGPCLVVGPLGVQEQRLARLRHRAQLPRQG